MDDFDDDPRLERAERLFWERTRHLLTGPYQDLAPIWQDCLVDAGLVPAGVKAPVGERLVRDAFALAEAIKAAPDEEGAIDGYLAAYSEDLVHDVIRPGAFKTTIAQARERRRATGTRALWPVLWQHDKGEPIGYISDAFEDKRGLRCRFRLDTSISRGRQAYKGLRDGYLAFSIGYRPAGYEWHGTTRHLTDIALSEGSVVTFPANPDARPLPTN